MNERWIKAGERGPAHWVKLSGNTYYTVACQRIIGKNKALPVETQRVGSANKPGSYVVLPLADDAICEECVEKAKAQA